jgi:hypothetical protein
MSIDECRVKEFFLFYLLKIAERSDIHNSSIVNHHSSFHEVSYMVVERWVLARLRNRQFFSLRQLNETIAELLIKLNDTDFQKLPGCRKQLFEALDKQALKPLPMQPYLYAEWKIATVNIDYHIEIDSHYYSVPYVLIGKKIDTRVTENTIECFYKSKPVASHIRSYLKGRHTTVKEHMSKSHQQGATWTPQRFINWAAKIGPHTAQLIELILNPRKNKHTLLLHGMSRDSRRFQFKNKLTYSIMC